MTITFNQNSDDANIGINTNKLMRVLEEVLREPDEDWDLRAIYSALVGLTEVYREALRSLMKDKSKDEFDAFIDSVNIVISSYVSLRSRPTFEAIVSDAKNE